MAPDIGVLAKANCYPLFKWPLRYNESEGLELQE